MWFGSTTEVFFKKSSLIPNYHFPPTKLLFWLAHRERYPREHTYKRDVGGIESACKQTMIFVPSSFVYVVFFWGGLKYFYFKIFNLFFLPFIWFIYEPNDGNGIRRTIRNLKNCFYFFLVFIFLTKFFSTTYIKLSVLFPHCEYLHYFRGAFFLGVLQGYIYIYIKKIFLFRNAVYLLLSRAVASIWKWWGGSCCSCRWWWIFLTWIEKIVRK